MNTGNEMLDQFQPYDFGVACSFIFSYCTAMPDPPAFMRRPRHRRTDDAPRVEISDWVIIMAPRCKNMALLVLYLGIHLFSDLL